MTRCYNFCAGPASLPESVLETARDELLDWHGTGLSLMEMSHRSPEVVGMAEAAEQALRRLLGITDDYAVLFLQGGASTQFAAVPLNLAVAGDKVDEVFIGSCMTNIGHFRAAGKLLEQHKGGISTRMWIVPPTKMDEHQLMQEGYYNIFGASGARTEMPGCSLCMGNQARVAANSTVLSTSTRNFPNRLGDGANVYLTSAELASVGAILGRLPTPAEYMEYAANLDSMSDEIYRYMNFDQIASFQENAEKGKRISAVQIEEVKVG